MKAIKVRPVLVMLLVSIQLCVYSQSSENLQDVPSNATNYLELNCKLQKGDVKTSNAYTVSLILENREIESLKVKEGKSFKFLLKENTWYAIKIKNEESTEKIISINTWIPMGNRFSLCHYNLAFEIGPPISLIEAKIFDSDLIDFPVAVIYYDTKTENFNLDEKYYYNIREALIASMVDK